MFILFLIINEDLSLILITRLQDHWYTLFASETTIKNYIVLKEINMNISLIDRSILRISFVKI